MPEHSAVPLPPVIQGGMGVAVSSWPLARAVAAAGQLGVVSGTALDAVLARRLQDGDPAVKARLYNLGYGTHDTENWNDDTFSGNLKQFQKDQSLQESGSVDSQTESKLKEVYGS